MKRITAFYHRHRLVITSLIVVLVATVFLRPEVAYAQADPETSELLNDINEVANLILRFFSAWLWPVLLMIGSLLDNDLIFGGAMGDRLLNVWVQIRNLVNIIFVLILLAIAVYNVLGLGQEGGAVPLAFKTALPKFVLALIAVNFSFLAVKVVLDFTNVITGAVFALPSTAIPGEQQRFDVEIEERICGGTSKEMPFRPLWCEAGGRGFNAKARQFFSRLDRSNIAVVYAIKFGRAVELKFIRDGIKDITQLGFNIIFNAVLYVVYALSFIALFLVLLFRLVALWVGVVLSPIIALTIVLPNLKQLAGEGGEIQDKFIQNAIAPVTIGLVLSVGYIMLDGFQGDQSIRPILSSSTLTGVDPHALPTSITDLQQLMIAIGTVVVVWVGVFSAAEKTVAKGITSVIREKALGFGKWVGKLPTYAPILPISGKLGGGKASISQLLATGTDIQSRIDRAAHRSLLEPSPASHEDVNAYKNAAMGSKFDDMVKTIAHLPRALRDQQSWDALRDAMVRHKIGGVTDQQSFATKFGSSYSDGAAARLAVLPEFTTVPEFKAAGYNDPKVFTNAVNTRPAQPLTATAGELVSALTRPTQSLMEESVFGASSKQPAWTASEIDDLKKTIEGLPANVKESFLEFDEGRLNKSIIRIDAASLKSVSEAKDETSLVTAIAAARAKGATDPMIQRTVDASSIAEEVKRRLPQLMQTNGQPPAQNR